MNYTVTVSSDSLTTEFVVKNLNGNLLGFMLLLVTVVWLDSGSFDFTCLLHTYFRLPDISKTTISGLGGLQYVDKVTCSYTHTCATGFCGSSSCCTLEFLATPFIIGMLMVKGCQAHRPVMCCIF